MLSNCATSKHVAMSVRIWVTFSNLFIFGSYSKSFKEIWRMNITEHHYFSFVCLSRYPVIAKPHGMLVFTSLCCFSGHSGMINVTFDEVK